MARIEQHFGARVLINKRDDVMHNAPYCREKLAFPIPPFSFISDLPKEQLQNCEKSSIRDEIAEMATPLKKAVSSQLFEIIIDFEALKMPCLGGSQLKVIMSLQHQ